MKKWARELSSFLALGRVVWFLSGRPSCLVSELSVELYPFTSHPTMYTCAYYDGYKYRAARKPSDGDPVLGKIHIGGRKSRRKESPKNFRPDRESNPQPLEQPCIDPKASALPTEPRTALNHHIYAKWKAEIWKLRFTREWYIGMRY